MRAFATEIPALIDRAQLTRVLSSQDVVVNARTADTGRSFWTNLLLGIVPWLLIAGVTLWMLRNYSSGGGMLGASASRPRAGSRPATATA